MAILSLMTFPLPPIFLQYGSLPMLLQIVKGSRPSTQYHQVSVKYRRILFEEFDVYLLDLVKFDFK